MFNIKNLGEYHDIYLKTDVLLLCDIFEKFINVCLEYYDLNPCHYFSIPGLAWDAILKMTGHLYGWAMTQYLLYNSLNG